MKAFGMFLSAGAVAVVGVTLLASQPAAALTMAECSTKYKAAQASNTLNGMKWNDFRKAQCGADAPAAAPAAATAPAAPAAPAAAATAPAAPKAAMPAPAPAAAAAPAATGPVVFPTALSPKYASEKPGKARMHTCVDQYNANKAAGTGNGGLKWIQKGGGYYSECTKKLQS